MSNKSSLINNQPEPDLGCWYYLECDLPTDRYTPCVQRLVISQNLDGQKDWPYFYLDRIWQDYQLYDKLHIFANIPRSFLPQSGTYPLLGHVDEQYENLTCEIDQQAGTITLPGSDRGPAIPNNWLVINRPLYPSGYVNKHTNIFVFKWLGQDPDSTNPVTIGPTIRSYDDPDKILYGPFEKDVEYTLHFPIGTTVIVRQNDYQTVATQVTIYGTYSKDNLPSSFIGDQTFVLSYMCSYMSCYSSNNA